MHTILRLLTGLLLISVSLPGLAQDKAVIKALKKQYKEVKYQDEGYYLLYDKKTGGYGVANLKGDVIVPAKHPIFDLRIIEINGIKYMQVDNYKAKGQLVDMSGKVICYDWEQTYDPVENLGLKYLQITKLSHVYAIYTTDFKRLTDSYSPATLINLGGSEFLKVSPKIDYHRKENFYKIFNDLGKIVATGYKPEIIDDNGTQLLVLQNNNNCKVAYYASGNQLVPTFTEKINKVVTVAGNQYYKLPNGLFTADGRNIFPYTIVETTPYHFIIKNKDGKYGIALLNLDLIVQPKWNAITFHQKGKYSWFFARENHPSDRYAVQKNAVAYPNHVIDLQGNVYPMDAPLSASGLGATSIAVSNGKLYVNRQAIKGITAKQLAYTPPTDGTSANTGQNNMAQTAPAPAAPVTKDFPSLEMVPGSLRFVDKSGRNTIEANGSYAIEFTVRNNGKGLARNCQPLVSMRSGAGITVGKASTLSLAPGAQKAISIPITAGMNTAEGAAEFAVKVSEPSGFGTDESVISVNTHAFEAPQVLVSDFTVTSGTGSTLKKKVPFDLQLLVQNIKHGRASDVKVSISVPSNIYIIQGAASTSIPTLDGGQTKDMTYTLVANNEYASETIPVRVTLSEKYGKYAESRTIELKVNQALTASRITVDETVSAPREEITVARLNSDVDLDIPVSGRKAENTFAVIIANEGYTQVAPVPHAANDGQVFEQYCVRTLGIPERNIRRVTDATLNDMKRQVSWLSEIGQAFGEKAEIIFYYSGHGLPDEASGQAYILPVDGYHSDMQTNYPVDELYSTLAAAGAGKVTVFMDACFSGSRRGDGMLMAARGVQIKARHNAPKGKMVVFSASQGDETAYPYNSQKHGLFTYYLLEKLKETSGQVSLGELGDYITDNVKRTSLVENSKSQTPQVLASPVIVSAWRDIKL